MNLFDRRVFLNRLLTGTIGSLSLSNLPSSVIAMGYRIDGNSFTILFQGDSITDGNRGRTADLNHIMGHGYAFSIASRLGAEYPDRGLKFINKGVGGDTLADLSRRWGVDTLELSPDVLSVLVGINDVLEVVKNKKPFSENDFEYAYREMLDKTIVQFPHVLLVLGVPFVLPVGMVKENEKEWIDALRPVQEVIKRNAMKYKAIMVDYQQAFSNACTLAPASYWIWDGIHPTVAGHEIMARAWIAAVSPRLPIITPQFILQK